jgi:hypothetical protein
MHSFLRSIEILYRREIESLKDFAITFVTTTRDVLKEYNEAISESGQLEEKVQGNSGEETRPPSWERLGEMPKAKSDVLGDRREMLRDRARRRAGI